MIDPTGSPFLFGIPPEDIMKDGPAFQTYAADFYMDTAGWPPFDVGIYWRLLMYEWINGSLPNDSEQMARIGGSDHGNFKKSWCRSVGAKFFPNGNGNLINRKLEEVRESQRKYRESQVVKGIKSAKKRWEGHITPVTARLQPDILPKDNSSSSSLSFTSLNKIITQLFEKFWSIYPSRNGRKVTKKESLQFFKNNFKDETEINLLLKATENYSKSEDAQKGYAKDPIRFLKKDFWRDWVEKEIQEDPYSNFPRIGGKENGSQN